MIGMCKTGLRRVPEPAIRRVVARILLIDDDGDVRSVVGRMLASAGHTVVEAESGGAAIVAADAAATVEPFDLVLTDVVMPGMDGAAVLNAFARRVPRPKLVVMTGGSAKLGMDFLSIAPSLGADAAIAKPFRAQQIIALIGTTLSAGAQPPTQGTVRPGPSALTAPQLRSSS
jgi:CheY-like chemotaxis protein